MKLRHRLAAAAACAFAATAAFADSDRLNVLNWSDLIGKETVSRFEKESSVKVRYDILDSDDTLQARLLAGSTGYDVVFPSSSYMAKQIEAGVYEKLDWSRIPNRSLIDPDLLKKAAQADPGNKYAVVYIWGTTGIVVNATKVKQALGDGASFDSWDLLFKPEVVSKLKGCGVSLLDSSTDVFSSMLAYMGRNPNSKNPSDYQDAYQELRKIRPYVTQFSSAIRNDVAGGDVCVAQGWSGDAGMVKRRVAAAKGNFDVRYVAPAGKTGLWFTLMGIPKDAPNKDNAYKLLNYLLRPEVAADITNEITYASGVATAKKQVRPELAADTTVYPTAEQLAGYFVFEPLEPDTLRLENKLWLQLKAGR